MKRVIRVLLWIAAIVGILLIIGAFLPGTVSVSRSVSINAPVSTVYNVLSELKTYNHWMPWNQKDTAMKQEYSPVTRGKGAWYKWESKHPEVGNGKLTISDAIPDKWVNTSLEFEGFDQPSAGGWELTEANGKTTVTWKMDAAMGHNPVNRWMGLFFDRMIGPDFEKGLAQLRQKIENGTLKGEEARMTIEEITVPAFQVLTIMDTATVMGDIGPKLQKAYGEISDFLLKQNLDMAGMPMSWYYTEKEPFVLEAAIPVKSLPSATTGRVKFRKLPAGKAVIVHFYGPYEETGLAYDRIREWLTANNKKASGAPYDIYVDDPSTKKSMYDVRTDIVQSIE
ncbi:SRPBCC family protein [Flavihumibacter stibioxidans]|uniref:AraC effector-binding domain-containing protein n=1 Tax=Flavihumibacter stibioxidans TaxID=1834163 RepID=A0ABR7M362_9BACT|nr:SRPBCC family protein [Flavihumibacter stibioxidans]MBC6489454.1 hypothetical protein [Flavihumibacter stibioxidans]